MNVDGCLKKHTNILFHIKEGNRRYGYVADLALKKWKNGVYMYNKETRCETVKYVHYG
jgi:hypothetical protein